MTMFQKTKFTRPSFLKPAHSKSIGYTKYSSDHAIAEAQVQAFKKEGCFVVFFEESGNFEFNRSQLNAALETMQKGDELIVDKLNRLGMNQTEVISIIFQLQQQGKYIRTLDGQINTKDLGQLAPALIGLLSGIVELENSVLREKNLESIRVQHHRNNIQKVRGRPKTNQAKGSLVIRLRKEGFSYRSIREQTGLALSTIRRIIVEESGLSF